MHAGKNIRGVIKYCDVARLRGRRPCVASARWSPPRSRPGGTCAGGAARDRQDHAAASRGRRRRSGVFVEGNAELTPARLSAITTRPGCSPRATARRTSSPGRSRGHAPGRPALVEELNRVPEETLNVLLGVLTEREMHVPGSGGVEPARLPAGGGHEPVRRRGHRADHARPSPTARAGSRSATRTTRASGRSRRRWSGLFRALGGLLRCADPGHTRASRRPDGVVGARGDRPGARADGPGRAARRAGPGPGQRRLDAALRRALRAASARPTAWTAPRSRSSTSCWTGCGPRLGIIRSPLGRSPYAEEKAQGPSCSSPPGFQPRPLAPPGTGAPHPQPPAAGSQGAPGVRRGVAGGR